MNTVWAECQATSGVCVVTTLLQTVRYSEFIIYQNVGYHNSKTLSCGLAGVMSPYNLVCDIIGTLFSKEMTTVEKFLGVCVINIPE
jgi:hypothetical protein